MKKNYLYSLIAGISTSVIGSFIYDLWKSKPFLSTLGEIVKAIWNFIALILNYEVKVWWFLMAIFILIGIIYLILKFNAEVNSIPKFTDYKEDRFKNWRWTWDWKLNKRTNKWNVTDLTPYCPKCETILLDNSTMFDSIYECPNCDFSTGRYNQPSENIRHIEALIIDKSNKI